MSEDKTHNDPAMAEKEGPVVKTHMNRIRAAKKKLRKIETIQQLVKDGKEINSDQRSTLNAKEGTEAVIDELERMMPLLNQAVKDEHGVARTLVMQEMQSSIEAEVAGTVELLRAEASSKDSLIGDLKEAMEQREQQIQELNDEITKLQQQVEDKQSSQQAVAEAMEDVLTLMYFGQLFNQGKSWPAELERKSCISYDSILSEEEAKGDPLQPKDLDAMVVLSNLMASRKVGEVQSHKSAIQSCRDLAVAWVSNQNLVLPELSMKILDVKQQMQRITASEYFTILPKVAGADDVAAGMNTYLPQMTMPSNTAQQQVTSQPQTLPGAGAGADAAALFMDTATQKQGAEAIAGNVKQYLPPQFASPVEVSAEGGEGIQQGARMPQSTTVEQRSLQQDTFQTAVPTGVYPQVQNGIQIGDFQQATQQPIAAVPIEQQVLMGQQPQASMPLEPPQQYQMQQPVPSQQQVFPQYAQVQQGAQQQYGNPPQMYQQQGGRGRGRGGGRGQGSARGASKSGQYGRGGQGAYGGGMRYNGRGQQA